MLPLFVLIIADVGAVPAGAAAAPASDGASGVVVWLERGSFSLGVPQWRGVKDAFGMQWRRTDLANRGSGSTTRGERMSLRGTPASWGRGTGVVASRAIARSSAAVAAPQLNLGSFGCPFAITTLVDPVGSMRASMGT